MDSYISQFWISASSCEVRSLPPMSLTISISCCSVSSPSFMLLDRPAMAFMGFITLPVACAAS